MDRLWAPWRAAYVQESHVNHGCVFCDLPAQGPAFFQQNLILTSSPSVFVILNRYPYNAGHLMVIPRHHAANLIDVPSPAYMQLCDWLRKSIDIVKQELRPDGINVGMNLDKAAGAGVADHCHFHIVPRWNGDTNFMPVLANTKVVSESLDAMYQKLFPAFQKIASEDVA